jgi:polyisoprenoid-binding protein YceI
MARATHIHPGQLRAGLALAAALAAPTSDAAAALYHVDTSQANEVRFLSDAPIEDFEGTTARIDGYVFWQGDALAPGDTVNGSEVYFEVPLNALSTGIDMRDRHMREHYLHTDRYPYVSFKGRLKSVERAGGDTLRVTTQGKLDLHGQSKDYEIACVVTGSHTGYAVAAGFDIRLTDFDIEVPSLMFLKIGEVIKVQVNAKLAPAN